MKTRPINLTLSEITVLEYIIVEKLKNPEKLISAELERLPSIQQKLKDSWTNTKF